MQLEIHNGWLTQQKITPSPHFEPRACHEAVSLLVIHYISLPPEEFGARFIDDLFLGTLDCHAHPSFADLEGVRVSAHCLIRRTGEIVQFVNFNDIAWHAGVSTFNGREKCNQFSIGIELEGSNNQPFTDEQYASLIPLTQAIQRAYPAITNENIVGHCDIAPERKIDPGQYFDWARYKSAL